MVKKGKDKSTKEPKAPKKKLTKKEKLRLAAELAEQQRIEQEQERQRLIQEEKARVEKERLANEEKAKRDVAEQGVRAIQLQETIDLFSKLGKLMYHTKLVKREKKEWEQYMKCDGLPDPSSLTDMNTYLYLWRSVEERGNLDEVVNKTAEVLALLDAMQEFIDNPLDVTPEHVENWKQVRNDIRVEQHINVNRATYLILRNIEEKMKFSGMHEVRYMNKFEHFILCLWSLLALPTPMVPLTKAERTPLQCEFTDVGVSISLPDSLIDVLLVVRVMLVMYDHLSDLCPSWVPKPLPEEEKKDLYLVSLVEWDARRELQVLVDEENERRAQIAAKIAAMKPSPSIADDARRAKASAKDSRPMSEVSAQEAELQELQQIQQTPVKTASELFAGQEDEKQAEVKSYFQMELRPHELNLRKYYILGGVYHIDLLQQPPQPEELHNDCIITVLERPTELLPVEFHEKYVPPPPPEPGQRRLPEEIEAELKKQEQELEKLAQISVEMSSQLAMLSKVVPPQKEEVEEESKEPAPDPELQKLVYVNIKLPGNVLWFEPPIVAGWDKNLGFWSTEDFHDLKFNEDKQVLTFRTGRFGPVGLAAFRYANLPYQTWELKPYKGEGVVFNITAAVMIVEFIIKGDKVCVNQLQNGATEALQEIVGKYYSPYQLRKLLCTGGVDLFPPHDAYCYIDGATPKHRAAEDHLYHCMALLSTSHSFAWSRWNLLAGRRNLVLQMREFVEKKRQHDYSLLLVTPLKACIVDCTEMSQSFSDEGVQGTKFCSDLYHLVLEQGSLGAASKINNIPFTLAETVFEMLVTTRVLSFS
ncbi:dynein axonemal intermediate chain 7 homolog [Periplaneta americana]|uniref:dynein axonemal intermediate chain 7 homolog n=1 Tax=Periplaneta americana TaxID=6978 RepID=UPI0037E9667E